MKIKLVLSALDDKRWNRRRRTQQQNNSEKNWLYQLMFHAGLLLLGAVKSTLVWRQLFIQFQLFFFQRLVYSVHVAYSFVKHVITCHALFIYPIAIAYNMGEIIKSVCVCLSVCLSVCEHSHGRISWSIFTKIGTDVRTPQRKNEFVRGQYRTTPSPILPKQTPILG